MKNTIRVQITAISMPANVYESMYKNESANVSESFMLLIKKTFYLFIYLEEP